MLLQSLETLLIKEKKVGTMFMDLSKAFDTLNDNLLLTKLNAHGFSFNAIKLVQNYLLERFQSANINNDLGSNPGPLLFNTFIYDNFYFIQESYICRFADDYLLYSIEDDFKEVKNYFNEEL